MSELLKTMPSAYEPKKKNRWMIRFPDKFKMDSYCFLATSRPKFIMVGGKFEIEPIRIVSADPIGPSTTTIFMDLMNEGLFDYKLNMLDPTGRDVEEWEINGCKILEVDFGDLSYSKDELATCSMLIQPSDVQLKY